MSIALNYWEPGYVKNNHNKKQVKRARSKACWGSPGKIHVIKVTLTKKLILELDITIKAVNCYPKKASRYQ